MSLETEYQGPRRVVIDRVMPNADNGLFPIKRAAGDPVDLQAWVLADGHDKIRAVIQNRVRGAKTWWETPLREGSNDEWHGTFTAHEIGFHEYRVVAWIDHFESWITGFRKKADEGQRLDVELHIGADLLEGCAKRAEGHDADRLKELAAHLKDDTKSQHEREAVARGSEAYDLASRYPDRSLETASITYPMLVERERAAFSTWYEFFPRSWGNTPGQHGTFAEAQRILPEIQRMGFSVVYLPPIHPIGQKFRKGRNNALEAGPEDVGSPWAIGSAEGGHKSVHPELGGLDQFRDFIWRCGELGMEVALDIAFQCSPDHPYIKDHPEWFKWRPDGTIQYAENPPKKYQDIVPFDFETKDWKNLWKELKSVFEFWIGHGVKIFRVDNPHTKALEFWRWCIQTIKAKHPDVIFLAEAFTRPKRKYRLGKAGFTHGYTYFTWRTGRDEIRAYLEELTQSEAREYFWPNFWPNTPDILHEYLQVGGRAGSAARYVLAATLSSNIGIYGPAFELLESEPFPGKEEYNWNEKYEIKQWDWDRPGNLKNFIARVNRIRLENRALQRTCNVRFVDTSNPSIIAYLKATPDFDNVVLTVINLNFRNTEEGTLSLPMDWLHMPWESVYQVEDLLDGSRYTWQGGEAFVRLEPRRDNAHIFRLLRESRR